MPEEVRRRRDTDGCGCVRCRSLAPTLLRQSLGGDLLWGVRLLVRRPSIPLLALALFLVIALLDPVLAQAPQRIPLVDISIEGVVFLSLLGVFVRAYTAAVAVGLLTGGTSPADDVWPTIRYSLGRAPAVAAVLALTIGLAFAALAVASQFVWLLDVSVDAAFGVGVVGDTFFDGPAATLVFGSVMVVAAVKFWLAPEICVVGGYAPWTAMRVSWTITRLHRFRLLVVVAGFAATTFGPQALAGLTTTVGGVTLDWIPGLELCGFYLQALLAAVWFAVGTQIYLRAAVAEPVAHTAKPSDSAEAAT